MSDYVWPPDLPDDVLVQGFKETLPRIVLKTDMDAGPPKRRRRFTSNVRSMTAVFAFTPAEYELFVEFYLVVGADPFDWTHPITGDGISFCFDGEPDVSADGPITLRVTVPLEVQL